jgi:type VI secretion system protein VasJ
VADPLETLRARTKQWLEPIPGAASPGGAVARLDPAYQAVASEVGKLDMPAGGEVNWKAVVAGAGELLQAKTKDFVLASFLAQGLSATGGVDGLATGLALMADLLEQYWETGFPEVKRVKGRVNAVQWLLERTKNALPALHAGGGDGEPVDRLVAAGQRLAEVARARLADQTPAFGGILEEIGRLKGEADAARPPPAAPAPPPEAAQSPQAAAPTPAAPTPAAPRAAAGPAPSAPAALGAAGDPTEYLRGVGAALASAAALLRRADPEEPLPYRLLRTGIYLPFQQTPAGGAPPPPDAARAQLAQLAEAQRWPALLEESEAALARHPLWLDLHRLSAQALDALDWKRARRALLAELTSVLTRLQGLAGREFGDGKPYADAETVRWLEEEVFATEAAPAPAAPAPAAPAQGAAAPPADAELLAAAREQLAAGNVADGLTAFRAAAQARPDGRGRYAARLELARAAADTGLVAIAKATYEELDREALAHRLDEWEPGLAVETLKGLVAAARAIADDPRGAGDALVAQYQRLCRLDPAAAHEVWP